MLVHNMSMHTTVLCSNTYNDGCVPQTPDVLHPLSSLEWEQCPSLPVEMSSAQAVFLDGTLHVGGGITEKIRRDYVRLYSYKPGGDYSWTATDTPTYMYALITYDTHLVLVGGREYPSEQITNKVYTMKDGNFKALLPPMKERRYFSSAVSSGSVLVVAGGSSNSGPLLSVEVFKDGQWTSRQSFPKTCYRMRSVLCGNTWILLGGDMQGTNIYSISLHSLISGKGQSTMETLANVPYTCSAAAIFGSRILSIGGWEYPNHISSIHAYSSDTQSWVLVGDLPAPLSSTCAVALPTGELMVIGGEGKRSLKSKQVFRAFIRG